MLTQHAVAEKSNEITAIPEVLKLLDVKKAIVTIDAMGCQKEIAAQIKDQKADYVLAVKDNQPTLHADVQELFVQGMETDFSGMKHQQLQTKDTGHGRKETRTYTMIRPTKDWLAKHPEWKGLKTLGMVCSERQVGDGEPTGEVRFFITSLSLDVATFAGAGSESLGDREQPSLGVGRQLSRRRESVAQGSHRGKSGVDSAIDGFTPGTR